jgi:Kef-type K+ transport system membrane component KefB
VTAYAVVITGACEAVYVGSKLLSDVVAIHLEVLLPAFVLGCVMARPSGVDLHVDDTREGHQEGPESPAEQRVAAVISGAFMVLVGLSMPSLGGKATDGGAVGPGWIMILVHVMLITLVANLGKLFPVLCYRRQAHWRERLAVAVSMFPRGEVGAGVLVVSLSYGIGGPMVTVAVLSLALNLLLTGAFIVIVQRLIRSAAAAPATKQ